jgi:hypothetical protein
MHHDFVFWALAIATVGAFSALIVFGIFLLKNAMTKKPGEK